MPRQSPEIAGPEGQPSRFAAFVVCGFLLLAVGLVFGRTINHEFVEYDDNEYIYENPHITQGSIAEKIGWAFQGGYANNWHPLTWLSHILDYELYGLQAGGHHATSVLLHAAAAVLLFLVLRRMTGDLWPSAFVAAIFAIHPLRVESVAWVAERKDVLSGLFFMLTLLAYVGYVRRPFSLNRYLTVMALFALGLMAKPMLVTLPLVLLLLDYWPLGRLVAVTRRVVLEKIPLFVLAAASCVATTLAQGQAVAGLSKVSLLARLYNAPVSYEAYLGQFFYPVRLAALYPHLGPQLPLWKAVAALLVLAAISIAVLKSRRRRPAVFVGWFWYLGMLVPVIGLVQVGSQAMADRYTYLPQIGLCMALAWGASQAVPSWPYRRWLCGIGSALVLAILMACAWRQTTFWRNSVALWNHALECTSRNSVAHNNFGYVLSGGGQTAEAIAHYRQALEIEPDYVEAHNNLGTTLAGLGRMDEAIVEYRKALKSKPDFAGAHNNLGNALFRRGQIAEAAAHYRKALEAEPDFADAHNGLGNALQGLGRLNDAIAEYRKALESKPDDASAHNNLANALKGIGQIDAAIAEYRKSVKINPDFAEAHCGLGNALLSHGQLADAVREYRKALEIKPELSGAHLALANALRDGGRLDEAIAEYRKTLKLQPDYAQAHCSLGSALVIYGRGDEAIVEFRKALEIMPNYAQAHNNLGNALLDSGQFDEAIAEYREALKILPTYGQARSSLDTALAQRKAALKTLAEQRESLQANPNDLVLLNDTAWALATNPNASLRNGAEAVEFAQRAEKLSSGHDPAILATLAAAYAEARRFFDAVQTARKAADLAAQQDKPTLLESLKTQIPLYEAKTPFHQTRNSSIERSVQPY
jgi:tetratricopeptide (TPR) repeat protein